MKIENDHTRRTVVLFSDAPYVGGAERYLFLLAAGMESRGFRPVLVMNEGGKLEPLKAAMAERGFDVFEMPLDLPRTLRGVQDAIRLLKRLDCSIFHINLPGPFDAQYSLVAPIARLAGIRNVVSTEHLPMVPSFAKGRIIKSFSTRFIHRVITVSRDNVQYLTENHRVPSGKIRVVYNGVPDSGRDNPVHMRAELSLGEESVLVAVIGALEQRKGHMTLFRAMSRLPALVHLLVIGEGPMEQELRQAASELAIGERVHFLGFRSNVTALLKGIDLLSVPSFIEATPYVILEAMAAGIPVVASSVHGIPEQVEDGETGLLVRPGQEEELAAAILRFASERRLTRRMGAKARERYESLFTLERFTQGTVNVYQELLGS